MKLFQNIKQFFKDVNPEDPKIADPVFGSIYWDSYWWYVNRLFAPTGREIGVTIVTDVDGTEPDERHRSLYLEIEDRYFLLKDAIVLALYEHLAQESRQFNWNLGDKHPAEDLWSHLRHDGIGIENVDATSHKWSLEYYCDWSDCVYVIHMKDWSVSDIENIGG